MTDTNGLTTRQLLERMDRRDERMDRWIEEQRKVNADFRRLSEKSRKTDTTLAESQIIIARLLDRMDDRVSSLESEKGAA